MFFRTLATLAIASTALASPLRRYNGLKVSLASNNVSSIADLKVDATVSNTGTEDVKVLKYGTILDGDLPTRSFTLTKDDKEVSFIGAKVSLVSLDQLPEEAYVTIPAGKTITVSHNLEKLYDFEAAGAGTFSIAPVTNMQLAGSDSEVKSSADLNKVEVSAEPISVGVSGDVARREQATKNKKRAVVSCSNSSQASFISASYTEGKALASGAASYISSNGQNSLYTAYWSANSPTTVRNRFTSVANENSGSRTLSCSDPYGVCTGGVIAYTVTSTTNIYYCSIFYNEVPSTSLCSGTSVNSRNVRGGTTLHELTHAVVGTDDVTYGCPADQQLSQSNKLANADNYNCFATQVYANTRC